MLWFDRLSPQSRPTATTVPLSREAVVALHGRLVDRVLRLTGAGLGIPDDFALRFDVMIFYVSAVLRHLHAAGPSFAPLSQQVWEVTFEGLAESLRDRGITDLRLASRMRKVLQDATGRRNAYLAAWEQHEALRGVIARNVFNGADPLDPRIDTLLASLPDCVQSVLEPWIPIVTAKEGDTRCTN